MKRALLVITPLVLLGGLLTWTQIDRTPTLVGGPTIVASLGDSITRAFNPDRSSAFKEELPYSWATGDEPYVRSHVDRLRSIGADIQAIHNNAVSGARSADLRRQMRQAIKQKADYVTIQIGSNDLCAIDGPSVEEFTTNVRAALIKYEKNMPNGRVFITSTPNLYRLYEVLRTNTNARMIWQTFGICPAMLSVGASETNRQALVEKQKLYNIALKELCDEFVQCRFDNFAVYGNNFTKDDISNVDYFHPSISGQRRLAEITWKAGFWPDVPETRQ